MSITVRLDKWLWATRFYKTRNLAKQSVNSGKVHYNGEKVKPSKEVKIGDAIRIRKSQVEKTLTVLLLADKRRNATEASLLYCETKESITKREKLSRENKVISRLMKYNDGKPSKKERRNMIEFKRNQKEN